MGEAWRCSYCKDSNEGKRSDDEPGAAKAVEDALVERDQARAALDGIFDALSHCQGLRMIAGVHGTAEAVERLVADNERLLGALAHSRAVLARKSAALDRISTALTATGRDADSCGQHGPADVAEAAEEALLDLKSCEDALHRVSNALTAAGICANGAEIAAVVEEAVADLSARWLSALCRPAPFALLDVRDDVLRPAAADGGDCGGEA